MSEESLAEGFPTGPDDPRDSDPLAALFQRTFADDLDGEAMEARILEKVFGLEVAPPKVGRFEILDRLGGGSMGTVYSAWDPELKRQVALKLIPRRPNASAEEILREARTLALVDSPHIIPVYDVGVHGDRAYLAMKNIEGQTLAKWQQAQRSLPEILAVYVQAAQGLVAMHRAGVIHCDFKPDNVLVDVNGWVWVSDFGLARIDGVGAEMGRVGGTPGYMAPEQLFNGIGSPASDQFSFCVALFKALYGSMPFPGKGEALGQRLARCEIVFPVRARRVPRWLVQLLRRGLRREANQRYAGMEALLADLSRDRGRPARISILAMILTAATAAMTLLPVPSEPPKLDPLAYTWDAERRAELNEHFESFELPWVTVSGTKIITELDDWAYRWNGEWAFAQTAGKMLMEGPIVNDCLIDQRARVQSFIDDLGHAEAARLAEASELATDLPDPRFCWAAVHGRPMALEPELADRRQADLTKATSLRLAMDFEGAQAILDELLIFARAEEWPALEIDVLYQRGLTSSDASRRDLGLADVEAALRLAIEYGDFARVAELSIARVWIADATIPRMVWREWMDQAEAYQHHLRRPSLANRLAVERSIDAMDAGEPELAEVWMNEHLDGLKQSGKLGTLHEIECLHTLALALDAQGASRATEAEDAFQYAIARAELVYGSGHPQLGKLLTDAGQHAFDNGDPALARTRMMHALELRRAILPANHPFLSRSYIALAGLELRLNNLGVAKAGAEMALRHYPEPDRVYEIYEILGQVAMRQDRWRDAVEWNQRALAACPAKLEVECLDLQISLAGALVMIGDHQAATERFDRYLPAYEESFDLSAEAAGVCPIWAARIEALDDEDEVERETRRVRTLLAGMECELTPRPAGRLSSKEYRPTDTEE